jgi:hypothetical protein
VGTIGVLTLALCCASVAPRSTAGIRFTDVTAHSGIDLVTTSGEKPSTEILEVNGTGLALFDFDDDGDLDLFVANGATLRNPERGPGSRLFANRGDGTFEDVTRRVGLKLNRWAAGVATGDYDGDGDDDLYVTCYGPNVLLRNDERGGKRRFVDVTRKAGVGDALWGESAAFGDIDADGDLDLYVANYLEFDVDQPPVRGERTFKGVPVFAGPLGLAAQRDVLYENLGDGTFRDVTAPSGCLPDRAGYGLGVVIYDFDGDARQDIFVGNDSTENFLFRNLGDGKFREAGLLAGVAADFDGRSQATMGIAVGDVTGNGLADLFTTNFSSDTNTLHVNLGRGLHEDRTSQYGLAGISRPYLSWGCGFHDFDSDGDEDLLIASGHIYPEAATEALDSGYEQPLLLFERTGRRFARTVEATDVFDRHYPGRALAFGDLDDDGDVDFVLTSLNDPVRVFRNDSPRADVVVVELRGKAGNLRGLGSLVELEAADGVQRRWIHGGSYLAVDDPAAYFALATAPASRSVVRVRWPDGTRTEHVDLPPNHRITIIEGQQRFRARVLRGRDGK